MYVLARTYLSYISHMLVWLNIQRTFWTSLYIRVFDSDQPVTHTGKYFTKRNCQNFHTWSSYVATRTYNTTTEKSDNIHGIETYSRNYLEETKTTGSKRKGRNEDLECLHKKSVKHINVQQKISLFSTYYCRMFFKSPTECIIGLPIKNIHAHGATQQQQKLILHMHMKKDVVPTIFILTLSVI